MSAPRAVVLLSGGMDSATAAAIARADGFLLHALTVRYGQRHAVELEAARRVARALGVVEHRAVDVGLDAIGGSALTDAIPVPMDRAASALGSDIPATYVPARNTVFLSLALGHAEVVGAFDIVIGANALDYSGYPDCRPEYLAAFERLANLATRAGAEGRGHFTVHAPLLQLTKREIVQRGAALGVDFSLTHTCYAPDEAGRACGRCDACQLRLKGFREAGMEDPVRYRPAP
ncbi:MAG TPA: 7-cyano-7-deazaguanine synthase QueC [Gemmatimonadales bacterium]|nr:7-cyano-7-deazaguanine synthase QueC [Gemmatimonadales bacterium]